MRLRAAAMTVSLVALLAACGGSKATPTPAPATPAPAPAQPGAADTLAPMTMPPGASLPAGEDGEDGEGDEGDEGGDGTFAPLGTLDPAASPLAGAAIVNANTATADELVAALTAAGVANADRWAREIQEYRPYDAADATLDKLRGELEKYNPGTDVIDAILSVLAP